MTFKIQIREYITKRANGDRDRTGGKDCSDYKVVIIRDDGKENVLREFSGYDNFQTHHLPAEQVRNAVEKYFMEQAFFFNASRMEHAVFRQKIISETVWEQVNV